MREYLLTGTLVICLTLLLAPGDQRRAAAQEPARTYHIMPQGNDSNCDYIAVANGIQNIGGDGQQAYWAARALVPQGPRDFKEAYYTLLGPNGSDQPFTLDNLGAAPEAFVGVYETLGYNAVFLQSTPSLVDNDFARTIRDRLAADPERTFAHLWITPDPYNPQARVLPIPETGETANLLYPYHEVAAMAAPDLEHVTILDGRVGHAYEMPLEQLAHQLRGFNRVIVVSRNDGSLQDHQRVQFAQQGAPYVAAPLGGAYLTAARRQWGSSYTRWGAAIGQPYRIVRDAEAGGDGGTSTLLPGEYVHYERRDAATVELARLGVRMVYELIAVGALASDALRPTEELPLPEGIGHWVSDTFGSHEAFHRSFGRTITTEFWLTQEQMQAHVLRGVPLPRVDESGQGGYLCVITEHALLAWDNSQGTFLLPLGRIYAEHLRHSLQQAPAP